MIRTCLLTDSCCRKGKKRVVSLCALDIAVLFRCQRYDFLFRAVKDIFRPEKRLRIVAEQKRLCYSP